jgi:hypothetical protein
MNCIRCRSDIAWGRTELGFLTCKSCGEREARLRRHTIVPMHKSNYTVVTDMNLLKQLNKRSV